MAGRGVNRANLGAGRTNPTAPGSAIDIADSEPT